MYECPHELAQEWYRVRQGGRTHCQCASRTLGGGWGGVWAGAKGWDRGPSRRDVNGGEEHSIDDVDSEGVAHAEVSFNDCGGGAARAGEGDDFADAHLSREGRRAFFNIMVHQNLEENVVVRAHEKFVCTSLGVGWWGQGWTVLRHAKVCCQLQGSFSRQS